jgi:hypothetical protein
MRSHAETVNEENLILRRRNRVLEQENRELRDDLDEANEIKRNLLTDCKLYQGQLRERLDLLAEALEMINMMGSLHTEELCVDGKNEVARKFFAEKHGFVVAWSDVADRIRAKLTPQTVNTPGQVSASTGEEPDRCPECGSPDRDVKAQYAIEGVGTITECMNEWHNQPKGEEVEG